MASVTHALRAAHVAQLSLAHLTLIGTAERIAHEALSETQTKHLGAQLMRAVDAAKGGARDDGSFA